MTDKKSKLAKARRRYSDLKDEQDALDVIARDTEIAPLWTKEEIEKLKRGAMSTHEYQKQYLNQFDAWGSSVEAQRVISASRNMSAQELQRFKQQEFEREREHRRRGMEPFKNSGLGSFGRSQKESPQRRILSRPVPVHWQGWETDTVKLQRSGWQLAVEFEPSRDMYSLMMNHKEMKLTAITSAIRIDHGLSLYDQSSLRGMQPASGVNHMPAFNVVKIAPSIENIQIQSNASWENYQLIDAEPQMVNTVIERVEDLNIFALAVGGAEMVAIDQADMGVVDHLQAIKDLQSDKQKELREKARKGEAMRAGELAVTGEVVVQLVDYK